MKHDFSKKAIQGLLAGALALSGAAMLQAGVQSAAEEAHGTLERNFCGTRGACKTEALVYVAPGGCKMVSECKGIIVENLVAANDCKGAIHCRGIIVENLVEPTC